MKIIFIFVEDGFIDEETLVKTINPGIEDSIYLGGVIFTNPNITSESNITYKIRLSAKLRNSGDGYELMNFFLLNYKIIILEEFLMVKVVGERIYCIHYFLLLDHEIVDMLMEEHLVS